MNLPWLVKLAASAMTTAPPPVGSDSQFTVPVAVTARTSSVIGPGTIAMLLAVRLDPADPSTVDPLQSVSVPLTVRFAWPASVPETVKSPEIDEAEAIEKVPLMSMEA